jgi:CHAT domain-containing protein/Tfp pilus assembly protein PilF
MLKSSWNIYITFAFVMWGMTLTVGASPSEFVSGNQEIFRDYYTFLESISTEPAESQISRLASFINDHPRFERPYLQLLTVYLQNSQAEKAERFFKTCLSDSRQKRNSTWALASLAAARDSLQTANTLFKSALVQLCTPYLLHEYVRFTRAGNIDGPQELENLKINPQEQHKGLAFYYAYDNKPQKCQFHLDQIKIDDEFSLYALFLKGSVQIRRFIPIAGMVYFNSARREAERLGDVQFQIHILLTTANIHLAKRTFDKTLSDAQQALEKAKSINDIERMTSAHLLLSFAYAGLLDNTKAIEHAQHTLDSALHYWASAHVNTYLQLALLYKNLSQYALEMRMYSRALEAAKKSVVPVNLVQVLRTRGGRYLELNYIDLAKHDLEQAYNLAQHSQDEYYIDLVSSSYGAVLYETGAFEESRETLTQAINSEHLDYRFRTFALFHLAMCYETEQNLDAALHTYEAVFDTAKNYPRDDFMGYIMALALPQIAALESTDGKLSDILSYFEYPILKREIEKNSDLAIDYYFNYARLYHKQGRLDPAIEHYLNAIKYVEGKRGKMDIEDFRISYFQETSQIYTDLASCYFERYLAEKRQSDLKNIFSTLQRCSGRTLQELSTLKRTWEYTPEYVMVVDSLQVLQRRLRDSVWKEESDMTAELSMLHNLARFDVLAQQGLMLDQAPSHIPKDVSFGELQSVCGAANLDVLIYHISESASFTLVVQQDAITLVLLDIKKENLIRKLGKVLGPLHNATAEDIDSVQFYADVAHELYIDLFQPITDSLKLSKNLFIVPGITLLNVPFEMFLTDKAPKTSYTPNESADYAGLFLQHDHNMTYSPSLAPLFKQDTMKTDQSLVVFSNPSFYDLELLAANDLRSALRSIFMQLPHADKESAEIQSVVGRGSRHTKGKNATKSAVIRDLQKYSIVHIATHAFVDSVFDAFSGLALATEDERDDGLLMGYELHDLALNNDLIVLSACESGAGKYVAGEGVLGLPRLFLRAGSKSVLMSLWKVYDAFPAQLMPDFYRYYLRRGKSKCEALAEAKRDILSSSDNANYKHPFYWATFCLYGDPGFEYERIEKSRTMWLIGTTFFVVLFFFVVIRFVRKRA